MHTVDVPKRGRERRLRPAGTRPGLDEITPGENGLCESLEHDPVDERPGGLHQVERERGAAAPVRVHDPDRQFVLPCREAIPAVAGAICYCE
jgi:hypothetical protein